ncbi:ABC transporter permease [Streptomyces sp. NPDC049813]|uniref:ABC transporter permease n=1 Tax=Streptomyces sp. NPDC049813 TaxID=3365597 RepID=UPI0037906594
MTALAPARPRAAAGTGGGRHLAGTGTLLRLALRRDRVLVPVWVAVVAALVLSMPGSLRGVYDTPADRAELLRTMNTNGAMRAMYGPVLGDSLGALTAWRVGTFAAVLAAVMSLLVVVRHTRDEEESGRQELVRAAVVGRHAPLTAALLAAAVADGVLVLLLTAGLAAQGAAGAFAFGLAVGGTGLVFAATAAVVAQFTQGARLARGVTAALLGAAFVLRAAGDAGTGGGASPLTWLSPVGWAEHVRAFAGERWWVPALPAAAVAAQAVVAYASAGRRDVGMSFLPSRPGPAHGRLRSAAGLALRLQRGGLAGWSAGFLAAGAVLGAMTQGAADLVGDNRDTLDIIERMGGSTGVTDAFLATVAGLLGMVAALYVVQAVLRLHGEETSQRAEPVLASAVGRLGWAAGHLVAAFAGAALVLLLGGAGLALGHGEDPGSVLGACLVQVPAVWTVGGLAVLLYGWAPRLAPGAWGVAGAALLLGWIGPALKVPQAVLDLSPYGHVPKLPGAEMAWGPVLVLTLIAAVLVAAGLAGLRRRDLTG